jgi:hypothetical protein
MTEKERGELIVDAALDAALEVIVDTMGFPQRAKQLQEGGRSAELVRQFERPVIEAAVKAAFSKLCETIGEKKNA